MSQKRYWIRGGVVLLILYILITAVLFISGGKSAGGFISVDYYYFPTFLPSIFLTILMPQADFLEPSGFLLTSMIIVAVSLYFSIGAAIGTLYGDIKN